MSNKPNKIFKDRDNIANMHDLHAPQREFNASY